MWTRRAEDLIAAFVAGNGMLDLIAPARLPMDLRPRTFAQAHALVRRSPYSHALARYSENRDWHRACPKAVSRNSSAFLVPTLVPSIPLGGMTSACRIPSRYPTHRDLQAQQERSGPEERQVWDYSPRNRVERHLLAELRGCHQPGHQPGDQHPPQR